MAFRNKETYNGDKLLREFSRTRQGKKFASSYFNDVNVLVRSINRYKKLHGVKDEYCLFDLFE